MGDTGIKRGPALILSAALILASVNAAHAQETAKLFKVITVRDEIVVGLAPRDVVPLGGSDVGHLGSALKFDGQLTAWEYAVRVGRDGEMEQAPLRKVTILGHNSLRVEAYSSPHRVVPAE